MSTGKEDETSQSNKLSNDDLYDLLADKRRRYTVHYLKQTQESVPVRDVAEQVAAWENGKTIEELTSQERKRVYIALYQSHLPTMHDAEIVNYDDEAGKVELAGALRDLDVYLEVVPQSDVPWSQYYVGLAAANAIILGLAWYDIRPFTQIPDIGWGFFVLFSFAVSALVQIYTSQRMRIGDEGPPPDLVRSEND